MLLARALSRLAEYNKYTSFEPERVHSLHVVSFHIGGDFGNNKAQARWDSYSLSGAPSNIYDGGHKTTYYTDETKINASGTRLVHELEMYLSKSIEGSTLSVHGNITNSESHSFNGFMIVFITENQLVDSSYGATWNFVFRDYGLNKTLSLAGLSTDTIDCAWSIPAEVKGANIQVVAGVFDYNSKDPTHGWPYAVQSVCDVCGHSSAKPGFLPTDLNKDGVVNILDITVVARAFGAKPGDNNWNAIADLDGNGEINILDITKVAKDYGKTV